MVHRKVTSRLGYCCLALLLCSTGMAAQQESSPGQRTRSDVDEIRKVSALLDTDVMNNTNEKVAGIEDLALSSEGAIRYAVLSHGGIAGVGAKYFAVPWEGLGVRYVNGKWVVNLDMTKEAVERAPTFQGDDYKDLMNPEWVARVHEYFKPRSTGQGQAAREPESQTSRALPMVLRATKIIGSTLKNSENMDLGKVEDLLLDRSYHLTYAIVGRGGVLGIGESYVPVPWPKLRLSYNRENTAITAVIDATKQQLEQAPLVKGNTYSTLLAPGFADQVDRYFGVTRPAPK